MSLLVVFFGVVAILEEQQTFAPMIDVVLDMPIEAQPVALFTVNGILSMVSDNVFVATIFIESINAAYQDTGPESVNMTRAHFEDLAIAINMVSCHATHHSSAPLLLSCRPRLRSNDTGCCTVSFPKCLSPF